VSKETPPILHRMFQIVFNDISAAEMAALPSKLQLELMEGFEVLPEEENASDPERFGVIERDGKKLLRYRVRDYRIYFERVAEGITIHRVLHRNTIRDFLFRAALPMPAEDVELARERRFWELIEAGKGARRH
jgi:hypothetical protein